MVENVYTQRSAADQPGSQCPVTALGEAFNPFTAPFLDDPYAFFSRARTEEPVFYSPEIDHWVVSRYEHVKAMLHDTETYSARMAQSPIQPWPQEAVDMLNAQEFRLIPNLTNNDPPLSLNYEVADVLWGSLDDMYNGTNSAELEFNLQGSNQMFPGYQVGEEIVL